MSKKFSYQCGFCNIAESIADGSLSHYDGLTGDDAVSNLAARCRCKRIEGARLEDPQP